MTLVFSPARARLRVKRLEMQRRDGLVGDDGALRAGREARDMLPGGFDEPVADQDLVCAGAERDVDFAQRRAVRRGRLVAAARRRAGAGPP